MKVGALIPCRTGSKGIPGKNFKDFCGRPLWAWTYWAALDSGIFDKVILSSDGGLPEDTPYPSRVEVDNERPAEMADDNAGLDELLVYYANKHQDIEAWCLLQPTSPLRTADDIKAAFGILEADKDLHAVASAYNNPMMGWVVKALEAGGKELPIGMYHPNARPNRQDRKHWFLENGAIYFVTTPALIHFGHRMGELLEIYEMPKERSAEIDDDFDWWLCEKLMEKRLGN